MKELLIKLASGINLTEPEAEMAMHQMMDGSASAIEISAYLTLLRTKGETISELTGSAKAMRNHALVVHANQEMLVDTCGTGGDQTGTFNISTASAIVAAAAGVPVAKHGNRAASSKSGSADVLQALGVVIELDPQQAERCLKQTGISFLFAQTFHPAMKQVAPVRKALGFRTMFNILGPLTNPAQPKRQVLGTPSREIAEKLANVLLNLDMKHALVVHSEDGLDELSIAGATHVYEVKANQVHYYSLTPEDFGVPYAAIDDVQGGTPEQNAKMIERIFQGDKGAPRDIVVMNAGAAIYVSGLANSFLSAATIAQAAIDSGAARATLERLQTVSNNLIGGMSA